MKGDTLVGVVEVLGQQEEWPSYYVVTSAGVYVYSGQSFVRQAITPAGRSIQGLKEAFGQVIREVRGDGEAAVILLENMDMIVFSIMHDPFGAEFRSWPTVAFCPAAKSASWKDEYEQMDLLE